MNKPLQNGQAWLFGFLKNQKARPDPHNTFLDVSNDRRFFETEIAIFVYDVSHVDCYTLDDLLTHKIKVNDTQVLWVRVTGLKKTALIQSIADYFGFHPLAIEDTLQGQQRAKVDDYPGYQFIVSHLLEVRDDLVHIQQLSVFFGSHFVVSFLEVPTAFTGHFDCVLHNAASRLRAHTGDYLVYELLDCAIDSVFPVLGLTSDQLDHYENEIMASTNQRIMYDVQLFKRDLRDLRHILWANRDMLNVLMRNGQNLINSQYMVFFRDCYDHVVRQIDLLESQRESALSLMSVYVSNVGNRLGQIMKILTSISIIFMPPTFCASVWGMNFHHMPELNWQYGYLFAWVVILMSSIIPSIWFWRKGWLRAQK